MASATSSTVCNTTISPVQRFDITWGEVHRKAHLELNNVTVLESAACRDRTFIVKALVTWVADNPVRIEPGGDGDRRYSTGFSWGHL